MALRVFTPMIASAATRKTRKSQYLVDDDRGTAEAGAAATVTLQAGRASSVDSAYVGHWVVILTGTGLQQARAITAYVGATRVATVAAWTTPPDATSTYVLVEPDTFATLRGRKAIGLTRHGDLRPLAKILGDRAQESSLVGA